MSKDYESFLIALDKEYTFPIKYKFKFIVPKDKCDVFKLLFKDEKLTSKISKKGNYLSFTIDKKVLSAESILDIYKEVATIKGVISL